MAQRTLLMAVALLTTVFSPLHSQAQTVEVALRVHHGRLLVPVLMADGTKMEFKVSTGTPSTVMSETATARLGDTGHLTLGGLPVPTDDIYTVSDEEMTLDGNVIDGIIGSNMLNEYNVLFDVPGGRMLLQPFGRSVKWDGIRLSDPVRLRVYHGVVIGLDVEFGDNKYPAAFDVGYATLVVNAGVKTDTHIQDEDVGSLRVGSLTFPDLPVRVEDNETMQRWSPDGAGFVMIGSPITYNCAISISYVHQEMRTCVR